MSELMERRTRLRKQVLIIMQSDLKDKAQPTIRLITDTLIEMGQFYRPLRNPTFAECSFFTRLISRIQNINSDPFRAWLSDFSGMNMEWKLWKQLIAHIKAYALNYGLPVETEAYWARREDAIYVSNGLGMVKITGDNVELLEGGSDGILFEHVCEPWDLHPPEESLDPFSTLTVFRNAKLTESGLLLLKLWSYSLPALGLKKPVLSIKGPLRSGKTGLAGAVQSLYTGRGAHVISADADRVRDLILTIDNGGVMIVDNYDRPIKTLPDLLAAASTGAVFEKRKLYSDLDRVSLRPRAAICLTSIAADFADDGGLADRLITVETTGALTDTVDRALADEIVQNRSACLSHIAWTLAVAMNDQADAPQVNRRHPDFSQVAVKIARALSVNEEAAVGVLEDNEWSKSLQAVELDPLGGALLEIVRQEDEVTMGDSYVGTAVDIQRRLHDLGCQFSTRTVGVRINNLWPHLQKVLNASRVELPRNAGYEYTFQHWT